MCVCVCVFANDLIFSSLSWGQYWGEMNFFRVELGKNLLGIEGHISWATPGTFSTTNIPCAKDGSHCGDDDSNGSNGRSGGSLREYKYIDPSKDIANTQRRRLRNSS